MGLTGMAAGAAPLLAACGEDTGAPEPTPDNGVAPVARDVELSVSFWGATIHSIPWALALEDGLFQERGVDVTNIVAGAGGGTGVRHVVTGGIPVGQVSTAAAISAFEAGAPLHIVSGSTHNMGDGVMITLPDRGVETLQDLAGRSVGITRVGAVTHVMFMLNLRDAGVDPLSVEYVELGGLSEARVALEEGVVDAATHWLPAWLLGDEQEQWQVVAWGDEYTERYMAHCMIAGFDTVQNEPDMVRGIIDAYQEAAEAAVADPERAGEVWSRHSEVPAEAAIAAMQTPGAQTLFDTQLPAEALNNAVEAMMLSEQLPAGAEIDWETLLYQDLLPEDKRVDIGDLV